MKKPSHPAPHSSSSWETRLQHLPHEAPADWNPPLVAPLYHSVKFTTQKYADLTRVFSGSEGGYFYSRVSNPTVRQLELSLARLQGRDDGIAVASGVAAISTLLFGTLKQGDHVILFLESYKPTRYLVRELLGRYGVRHSLLSIEDLAGVEACLKTQGSKLMIFESPTNPMLKVADLERLCALARSHGCLTALDNTFAGPHQHGDFPLDFFIHSLTKFVGGHGDFLGGAILGEAKTITRLRRDAWEIGASFDPRAADLALRGLKTYFLRYEKQCANALHVAQWLEAQAQGALADRIERVRHPGLVSHPQHGLAKKQMRDFGTMVAFDLKGGEAALGAFIDRLELFRLAASLGSTESLVAPALPFYATDLTDEERRKAGVVPGSIRLSLGVESTADLIADLAQALL